MENLWHYSIIGFIIVGIVFYQIQIFLKTIEKLKVFQIIFPKKREQFELELDEESSHVRGIRTTHKNQILKVIIDSINSYLNNNKGSVSDFHLMRDIVDRNCDAAEEEINTQIPVPLYYGLMGTMAGILIGIGYLVFSGGLSQLLGNETNGNGANGINALLGGVSLAMISSISGIFLTTFGSSKVKDSKAEVERAKNIFLSWIHSELLPELSSDMTGVFEKMTRNLSSFNATFSTNTGELRKTLSLVNDSYRGQAELLESINKLKISDIASANIHVYDKLKNCTEEIGYFSTYLHSVNEYIANVRRLNDKLDANESRTKAIEDMGIFFKEERANMKAWNGVVSKSVGEVDNNLQLVVQRLKDSAEKQFNALTIHTTKQREGYEKVVDQQNEALITKTKELTKVVDELKNLTAVKTILTNLEKSTVEQNRKIDKLADSIKELAQAKSGTTANPHFPKWLKVAALFGGSFLVASSLFFVVIQVLYIYDVIK